MSDNLNCSTEGFSKYDSMSIGELEEILRADAMGPERDDSDVDEILYVMEVLTKKRRQNGIAGKTALEAYQEFQQHYLPANVEVDIESVPKRKATVIPFRRIAAIAASLVLVFTLTTSANAFSFKDIWNAVARWAEETFSFSIGVEVSDPKAESELEYVSLQDALTKNGRDSSIVPTYIPDGYTINDIQISDSPMQKNFVAIYQNGESFLKISVKTFIDSEPEQVEQSSELIEIYSASGQDYYIFSNYSQNRAAWIIDTYECHISGNITIDELKMMIDSIGKG